MIRYTGDRYLHWDEIEAFCRDVAAAHPRWVRLSEVGRSREGRPMLLLTIGDDVENTPAFWLDGGTHAAEWTGVMATLYTVSRWLDAIEAGDTRFSRTTAYVMPCVSPDGYDAIRRGGPSIRSTLRPPRDGRPRIGLDPCDVDGDGRVRWMRWRHPSGSWVFEDTIRPRTLDDAAGDAWFVCTEGEFLAWDGAAWTAAPLRNGLDLNRNFPGSWAPFSMFGMDGGDFALSEPESRAVVDAFAARRTIAAGLSNHTYTGALLTQPYRDPSPLGEPDIALMENLGRDAVRGTGYRVLRTIPDFMYDPKRPIVGVWSDTMSTTFGVPGYTLELWDPFAFAGVANPKPGEFWTRPDPVQCAALARAFEAAPWVPFQHPQLGAIELGGIDLLTTMHNPPVALLAAECARGFAVADRLCRALPDVHVAVTVEPLGEGLRRVTALVENRGYLPTGGLRHGERIGTAPPVVLELAGAPVVQGANPRQMGWVDGWGGQQADAARHPLYPGLPESGGTRAVATWIVGEGPVRVDWDAGRGGRGTGKIVAEPTTGPASG